MRSFELNQHDQAVPVTEQPLAHPEMAMEMSPILRTMLEEQMARMALFQRPQLLRRSSPFEQPGLPDELRPQFDIGRGPQ